MEKLVQLDELTILELLDVTSEELVEFLADQVEEKYEDLIDYFSSDDDIEKDRLSY
jgi:hypothetical protein